MHKSMIGEYGTCTHALSRFGYVGSDPLLITEWDRKDAFCSAVEWLDLESKDKAKPNRWKESEKCPGGIIYIVSRGMQFLKGDV